MAAQENTSRDNVRSFNGKDRSSGDEHDERHEKLLPQNIEAEMAVLGSMLISPDATALVIDGVCLATTDFFREAHQLIYLAAQRVYCSDTPVDLITLCDELERTGTLEDAGGRAYVCSLPNHVPTSENAKYYAEIVKDRSELRQALKDAGNIAALAYDGNLSTNERRAGIERIVGELLSRTKPRAADDLFPLLSDHDAEQIPAARGIVGDILNEDSLAILYGPSGRWKSFLALAWSLCIATGKPWLGRRVQSGHVVYIAAEGGRGLGRRVTAWKRHHGLKDAPNFHLLPVAVNLLDTQEVNKLVRTIERAVAGAPVMIVLDTLSRSMPGADENTGKDGSRAIAAADILRRAFDGVTVLMVAHPGKNEANGIRGWSGYFQWADTVVSVKCGDTKPRLDCGDVVTLTSEKPKDNEPFVDISFTAQRVEWTDNDGAGHSSLMLVATERPIPSPTPSPKRRAIFDIVSAHGPISYAELWRKVSTVDRMSESTLNTHLKAMQADGQVVKNNFGAYFCPAESPESSKTA